MRSPDANRIGGGYELESELARLSLHATDRDPNRKLAWVNSVCILFLLVGMGGSKPDPVTIRPLPPLEEVSAAIVEPLKPPPTPQAQPQPQEQEQSNPDTPDTPQVVVVTPPSPSISFAVPTIGNLVVPAAMAKAPPLAPLKPVAPLRSQPVVLNTTGSGGERPQPPYPKIALEQGQQGSVTLRMRVDDAGLIQAIEIAQTSGFPALDHSALEFVKRHWTVPSGKGTRVCEATINYRLQID